MSAGRVAAAAAAGLAWWLLLGLVPGGCRHEGSSASGARVRNVVLVSIDTLRADRVGAHRGGVALTPRLDGFAARSVHFTNCRAVSSHTLASHKSILSGRLPGAFLEEYSQGRAEGERGLKPGAYYRKAFRGWPVASVASRLREAGLATAGFADGLYMNARYGFDAGFDVYASHKLGLAAQVRLAREWLESLGSRPFFLFVHTYDVHCPYTPPSSYLRLFEEACTGRLRFAGTCGHPYFNSLHLTAGEREHVARHYDAGVRHVDDELGALLDWLDDTGRLADTAVIVTSDHGESLGERDFVGHGQMYEDQLRVPLVVYCPRQRPGVVDTPVSGVDVGATMLDLVLGGVPEGLDGFSLRPLLDGEPPPAPFGERVRVSAAAVGDGRSGATHLRKLALLDSRGLKLITDPDEGASELFDLSRDPEETRDLIGLESPAVQSLQRTADRLDVGRLRGLVGGRDDLREEELSPEEVESLRALGYVED